MQRRTLRALLVTIPLAACDGITTPASVARVTIDAETDTVMVARTLRLTVTLQDDAGNVVTDRSVDWASDGPAASVDAAGLVTGVQPGAATITATAEGVSDTYPVTVVPVPAAAVAVSPDSADVTRGDSVVLLAIVSDAEGNRLDDRTATWASSDPAVARVTPDGVVVGVDTGVVTITAAVEGVEGLGRVRVRFPGTLSVSGASDPRQGDLVLYAASGVDPDGDPWNPAAFLWSVVPASAGLITFAGAFVGYEPGPATIVVTAGGLTDSLAITIAPRGLSGTVTVEGRGPVNDRFTSDLWVSGTYAYTGTWGTRGGNRGNTLYVWDVADPANPVLTDSVAVDAGTTNDVKVRADGALAVLTHESSSDGLNGITLLDLANPANPTVITRYTSGLESGVHNVWIEGDYVYVAADFSSAGLKIIDVSEPSSPTTVAEFGAGSSFLHDVYVRDGLAFLSHWDAGLVILDVGNGIAGGSPTNPVEVSRIVTQGGQVHNAWYWPAGEVVFVGEEDFGTPGIMHVVSVTDLRFPVETATFRVAGTSTPHNFWLDETREILYAAWYAQGVRAIDVSGFLLGELDRQGREIAFLQYNGAGTMTWAPQLEGSLVFLSDLNTGLWVVRPAF